VTLNQIFIGMLPFMVIQMLAIFLLYMFPQIGLWVPSLCIAPDDRGFRFRAGISERGQNGLNHLVQWIREKLKGKRRSLGGSPSSLQTKHTTWVSRGRLYR